MHCDLYDLDKSLALQSNLEIGHALHKAFTY